MKKGENIFKSAKAQKVSARIVANGCTISIVAQSRHFIKNE